MKVKSLEDEWKWTGMKFRNIEDMEWNKADEGKQKELNEVDGAELRTDKLRGINDRIIEE